MDYIQHFASQSANYLHFRPTYPQALFSYLVSLIKTHDTAWDCATGNGQAAVALSHYFKQVIATDINPAQLTVAPKKNNIHYYAWPAEKTQIAAHTINLITIAQALHWLNFKRFYNEVKRVAAPNSIIAAWCYSLCTINPTIDIYIKKLYFQILGETYLPKEVKHIYNQYTSIPFPFTKQLTPQFFIEKEINLSQFIGYLQTWSAIKEYQMRLQKNPIDLILNDLTKAWGDANQSHRITWPIHLLVGYISHNS
ncbi:MAG: hypothetical protein A3E83_06370 [Gammaproteobacteria bacterium RIFCSPHIGHO2_12_FULL_41_20]|nr:MAG: hypothetical protein A3E83_06370 [Gammaproteobacteria bacterium RIFCSPHIGHO2_12_FULL_41_20]